MSNHITSATHVGADSAVCLKRRTAPFVKLAVAAASPRLGTRRLDVQSYDTVDSITGDNYNALEGRHVGKTPMHSVR